MTDLSETERMAIIRKAKGLSEQEDESNILDVESVLTSKLKLPAPVVDQIMAVYTSLNNDDRVLFDNNFRKHSIDSFVAEGWKAFKEFFLVNVGGARGGMGNGEISILLGVKDSMPGVTAQHDIVLKDGEWEVNPDHDCRRRFEYPDPAYTHLPSGSRL